MLKEAAAKAEKQGITIGLENYLSAEDNLKILDRVGSPAVKVYYDVGNSTDKGHDIYKEIPLLGKRICEFHFKDGNFMLGQGRIDFKKVREALDDIELQRLDPDRGRRPARAGAGLRGPLQVHSQHFPGTGLSGSRGEPRFSRRTVHFSGEELRDAMVSRGPDGDRIAGDRGSRRLGGRRAEAPQALGGAVHRR